MIINKLLKLGLVAIIPHGITDIVDYPKKTLLTYSIINPIILKLSTEQKMGLLMVSSIYHLRNDVPVKLLGSSILHTIWLMYPETSIMYLSCIHTPRHYNRTLKTKKRLKIVLILLMSFISVQGIKIENSIKNYLGEYWWIGPIISHIIISEVKISNQSLQY